MNEAYYRLCLADLARQRAEWEAAIRAILEYNPYSEGNPLTTTRSVVE